MKRLLAPAAALLLAACGTADYRVLERPARPYSDFGSVEVRDVRVDVRHELPGDWPAEAAKGAVEIRDELRQRINEYKTFRGSGPALSVAATLVRYEAEYSEPKLAGGGGSLQKMTVVLEVHFIDERGGVTGRLEATGESRKGGWAVATIAAARSRAVDGVLQYLRDHRATTGR